MGPEEFARQLRELGYEPTEQTGRVVIDYEIPLGSHIGERVTLGFNVPPDFPTTPPGGPAMYPPIVHPDGAVNPATEFGAGWVYWSRPYQGWAAATRSVQTYMAHVRRLFSQS